MVPCIVTLYQSDQTRCNSMQVFIYCKIALHVSGVYRTHHPEFDLFLVWLRLIVLLLILLRVSLNWFLVLTFRHCASCILGQAFRYSPENVFYTFNRQIYFII